MSYFKNDLFYCEITCSNNLFAENIDPFGDHSGRHNSRIESKSVS